MRGGLATDSTTVTGGTWLFFGARVVLGDFTACALLVALAAVLRAAIFGTAAARGAGVFRAAVFGAGFRLIAARDGVAARAVFTAVARFGAAAFAVVFLAAVVGLAEVALATALRAGFSAAFTAFARVAGFAATVLRAGVFAADLAEADFAEADFVEADFAVAVFFTAAVRVVLVSAALASNAFVGLAFAAGLRVAAALLLAAFVFTGFAADVRFAVAFTMAFPCIHSAATWVLPHRHRISLVLLLSSASGGQGNQVLVSAGLEATDLPQTTSTSQDTGFFHRSE